MQLRLEPSATISLDVFPLLIPQKPVATNSVAVPVVGDASVTAIRVVVEQINEPAAFDRKQLKGDGKNWTGVGVQLVFSFYDQVGNPLKVTVMESVEALEGDKAYQTKGEVPLTDGRVPYNMDRLFESPCSRRRCSVPRRRIP